VYRVPTGGLPLKTKAVQDYRLPFKTKEKVKLTGEARAASNHTLTINLGTRPGRRCWTVGLQYVTDDPGLAVHPRRVLHGPAATDWRGEIRVGPARGR
jgi:hypothetical protein